ncbi:DUF1553 domain-containing protein [Lignipirellula cremea]|uniref:DUF1553 domain-containing protein n=1 Tax=Lignipirellula cremea TaxID=2528010 RepID=UPI0018D27084|nr:DUF1553 domain-containing protein [Lignipirellula cremea]
MASPCAVRGQTPEEVRFSRHVVAVFSRAGCNGGTCHGAVQGKNGFRLSLFGAKPELDFAQVKRGALGRRLNPLSPADSLLLQKATGGLGHGGGKVLDRNSRDFRILEQWIAQGAQLDAIEPSQITRLSVEPSQRDLHPGESYSLQVTATFTDGSEEEVTSLCSFTSSDAGVASVDAAGQVRAIEVGDAAMIVRFRAEPAVAMTVVARPGKPTGPAASPHNFIDEHILAKLKRLNLPPSELAGDTDFLRRVRLDVTGKLPTADEVREFLADPDVNKRSKKIEALLQDPGYAALWTLKFCDLLKANDFGVYADGLSEQNDAPRFQAWVRARIEENLPYDEFAARILTATSREGRSVQAWADEVIALQEGATKPRTDLELYAQRETLDAYWQRKDAVGVTGAMQIAHAFLGLRMECANCHRHPHDVWQQEDLLSFANFFMRVRTVGFNGANEKIYVEEGELFRQYTEEGKKLVEEAKKLKDTEGKKLATDQRETQSAIGRLKSEAAKFQQMADQLTSQATQKRNQAKNVAADEAKTLLQQADDLEKQAEAPQQQAKEKTAEQQTAEKSLATIEARLAEITAMDRRGKQLSGDVAKRIVHSQIHSLTDPATFKPASVSSPLGEQSSDEFRLLGQSEPLTIRPDEDPRQRVVDWLRSRDNPFFAKAIVNRVWAHYFGRGIIDPPDDLSPYNPPTHPELLEQLCTEFIDSGYDLHWLHRTILSSRTYQQTSIATADNAIDRTNYASFYFRRLPAEVLLDAINQTTGTSENFEMGFFHWPEGLTTVEIPYDTRNPFVNFMLEQFGRPARNRAVQCDCERQSEASMLQVLSLLNHPHIREKIADPKGRVAQVASQPNAVEELFLSTLSRFPSAEEQAACQAAIEAAESPAAGLQAVLWSLLNTREFLLQH